MNGPKEQDKEKEKTADQNSGKQFEEAVDKELEKSGSDSKEED